MASTRDIRRRIKSVKNTRQITKAMELVAASKMKKAQQAALASRPYAQLMGNMLAALSTRVDESFHPFLAQRPVKTRGILLVSTDKGLCGPLNSNLFRLVSEIKTPAKFDRDKLLSFNADAIQAAPPHELAARLKAHAERYHPEWIAKWKSPSLEGGGKGVGEAQGKHVRDVQDKWQLFALANRKRAKTLEQPFITDRFFVMADDDPALTDYSGDARKSLEGAGGGDGGR